MFLYIREARVLVAINNYLRPIFEETSSRFYGLVKVNDVVGVRFQEFDTVFDTRFD